MQIPEQTMLNIEYFILFYTCDAATKFEKLRTFVQNALLNAPVMEYNKDSLQE